MNGQADQIKTSDSDSLERGVMREQLREFMPYEEGEKIRQQLKEMAEANYVPQHPRRYLEFMNKHACSFTVNHPQSQNHPFYWCMFSVKSQHVHGDCVEECLDKAINA